MQLFCATAQIQGSVSDCHRKNIQKIVEKVYKHVCGHSSYSDINTLLDRSKLSNVEVNKFLFRVIENFPNCVVTSEPKQALKVSLRFMNGELNTDFYVDHLHLLELRVFHIMNSLSRDSVGSVVELSVMPEAITSFESICVSTFRYPHAVLFDPAFDN